MKGKWIIYCGDCSLRLDHESHDDELGSCDPCPDCGSRGRTHRWTGPNAGRILIRMTVAKKPGQKKPPVDELHGDVLSHDGKWRRIHRIIDRRRDHYYEKVHDPETREVLHEVEEPLSEHRGHGGAKHRASS